MSNQYGIDPCPLPPSIYRSTSIPVDTTKSETADDEENGWGKVRAIAQQTFQLLDSGIE